MEPSSPLPKTAIPADLQKLLAPLVSPSGRIFDCLFGSHRATARAAIMGQLTGVAKYPKAKAGANIVFATLCEFANVDRNKSHAGQETELVNWIRGN